MSTKYKDYRGIKTKGIYLIKNKVNNKIYVGSTSTGFSRRWSQHKTYLRGNKHHSRHLQNAWNKYGEENFEFSVLEEISDEKLNRQFLQKREQYWFSVLKPFGSGGYNICREADRPNPRTFTYKERIERNNQTNPSGYLVTFPSKLVLHIYNLSLFVEEWPELELQTSCLTACARGEQSEHKGFKCCFANPKDRIEWQPKEPKPVRYVVYNPKGERFEVNDLRNFCRAQKLLENFSQRFSMCASTYADPDYKYKRYHVDGWTCYFIENDPGKFIIPATLRNQKRFRLFDPDKKEYITQDLTAFAKEHVLNRRVLEKCASSDYPNKTYKGWYCFDIEDESYKTLLKETEYKIVVLEEGWKFVVLQLDKKQNLEKRYFLKELKSINAFIPEIQEISRLKRHLNLSKTYKNCRCFNFEGWQAYSK